MQATVLSTAQHRVKVSFLLNLPVKSKYRGTVDDIKVPDLSVECTRTAAEAKGSGLQELFLKLDLKRNSQVCCRLPVVFLVLEAHSALIFVRTFWDRCSFGKGSAL